MVEVIIPSSAITIDGSAKTLTLAYPYETTTVSDILSIYNLTKGHEIYNSKDPRKRKLFVNQTGLDISVSSGVITYIEEATTANTDSVQIIVNKPVQDVNITNSAIVGSSDLLTVYSSQSVAVSSTIESTAKDIRNVSYADIFIKNATGTNTTVNVYGSPDSAGTFKTFVGTTTLNASTVTQDELSLDKCPNYLFFEVINNDDSNAASVTISVQRTVLSDSVRPYSDVLSVYEDESVATSTTINSTAQDIRGALYVIPYIKNATSTDLTVSIYGSYNSTGTIKTFIRSYALNTVTDQAGDPITKCPNYLFFDVENGDSSNAATVNISVLRR